MIVVLSYKAGVCSLMSSDSEVVTNKSKDGHYRKLEIINSH